MSEKIDINTADAATLTTISGIGPALARRIVEYRETVHPFEEVIELAAVPGISEKMVRGFEDWVTVRPILHSGEEADDLPLLDGPEEVILLGAPDQPMALPSDEVPVEAAEPFAAAPADEDVAGAAADEDQGETAVPAASTFDAEIQDLPLADPDSSELPDPDFFAVAPSQTASSWEAKARRRGCLNALVGATFGAILGAVLTLAILAALNQGNLSFSASDAEIRRQLDTEIISRTNELNQLGTRISLAATEEAAANQALADDFAAANEAINETLSNNEMQLRILEQRLEEVAGAADTFSDFLDGLRLLLNELEGTATVTPAPAEETVSPPPTASATPTPTPASIDTPESTPTTAVAPTRTPQPTATPFTFPTNTPAPQP